MASAGHQLQQQKSDVQNRIETFRNEDLKNICRQHREQVSGTKQVLVARCKRVVNDIANRGDVNAFEEFKRKNGIRGLPALIQTQQNYSSSNSYSTPAYQQHGSMAPHRGGGTGLTQNRLPSNRNYFKSSPFHEVLQPLLPLQDLPETSEMPQNRHTVKSTIQIEPDIAQQFRGPDAQNFRAFLYCGFAHSMNAYALTDIAFPNQIEVKVNEQDVKHNFKGLKNKAGSTKPADITALLQKFNGHNNTIQITYALTNKRFAYAVYLVKSVGADKLVERIKKHNIIPRERVLQDMSKANEDPDIAAVSTRMSLKDPISTMRITLPVRSSSCTHYQCFDAAMFLQLQEQAPQWLCPFCSKGIAFDSLCVDKYFEDILNKTSKSIDKVDVEPNGDWKIIKEEEEDSKQQNGLSSKNARASYDDDFDDFVELEQPAPPPKPGVNGVKLDSHASSTLSPFPGQAYSMYTPPSLPSREASVAQSAASTQRSSNKRPQSAVIDLTLSDEEDDDPPRPAKRQSTIQSQRNQGSQSNSYNTPNPMVEPRYQPPQPQNNTSNINSNNSKSTYNFGQADSYRPSSRPGISGGNNSTNFATSPTNNLNSTNSMSPTNPVSPFGQPAYSVQHSRPSPLDQRPSPYQQTTPQPNTSMFPPPNSPFAMRSMNNNTSNPTGLRLPPMQTSYQQQSYVSSPTAGSSETGGRNHASGWEKDIYAGWRSDFDYGSGGYGSSSPG